MIARQECKATASEAGHGTNMRMYRVYSDQENTPYVQYDRSMSTRRTRPRYTSDEGSEIVRVSKREDVTVETPAGPVAGLAGGVQIMAPRAMQLKVVLILTVSYSATRRAGGFHVGRRRGGLVAALDSAIASLRGAIYGLEGNAVESRCVKQLGSDLGRTDLISRVVRGGLK